jgi:hypothetical protein
MAAFRFPSRFRRSFLTFDQLESRDVPSTTLFLDFGLGVGMGNTISISGDNFRQIFGAVGSGTNMNDSLNAGTDLMDFTPLNYDFDLDGDTDNADITALANAVVPLVQRALEPFDITVVVANNATFAGAVTSVGNNAGDPTGEFDAYVYCMTITSTSTTLGAGSVGVPQGLFGRAALIDLGAQTGNNTDEATLTFADQIFNSTSGTVGTAAFNQNLAQRMAYTATHEGFHTFSYVHTPDETPPTAGNNARLLASGDVIRRGSNTRENPFIVTRYDLQHDGAAVPEPNNYLLAANDPDIGLRDSDGDGIPDLAYSTGTGAHDQIILTNTGGGIIDVDVNPFSDQGRTVAISSESYNIDLATDAEGTILVDASINNDEVQADATINATLRLRGGQGIDGIATENDLLTLLSGGLTGTYTPGVAGAGTVNYAGGAFVLFSEFENVEASDIPIDVQPLTLSSSTIDEDDTLTLDVEFINIDTLDSHEVVINWGDNSPNTVFTLAAGQRTFTRQHQYRDDNPSGTPSDNYNITVTITDEDGDTGNRQAVVTVDNVDPALINLAATTIDENGTTTLTGTIADPGTLDTFTVQVNWGDPLSPNNVEVYLFPAGTTDFQLTHQYLDDNPTSTITDDYTISFVITDDDTGSSPADTVVTVDNVAPVITVHDNSASQGVKAMEGELVTVTGQFTDVGTLDTHEASIDWGDGTVTAGAIVQGSGSGSYSGGHAYAGGGIYTVTITVTDDDTEFDTTVETVFITGASVQTIDGKEVLFIVGTNGADRVQVNAQGNGTIRVHATFLPGGQRTFNQPIDEIRMFLCGGNDSGTIAGNVAIPALLDGGNGNDDLNAGGAGSVLLGGPGDDKLVGSSANDILIGGDGNDRLVGNKGDDLLIGGYTNYDVGQEDDLLARQAALMTIRDEWNSGRTTAERRANINGTGVGPRLNEDNFLQVGVSVFDDGDDDKLTGSAGTDWYFLFPGDFGTDFHNGNDLLN